MKHLVLLLGLLSLGLVGCGNGETDGDPGEVVPKEWSLQEAVSFNDVSLVQEALKRGETIDDPEMGEAYFQQAFDVGNLQMMKVLVEEAGVDPNRYADDDGNNYLHVAVTYNDLDLVKALVEAGVDPDRENRDEKAPLDLAEGQKTEDGKYKNPEMVAYLDDITSTGFYRYFTSPCRAWRDDKLTAANCRVKEEAADGEAAEGEGDEEAADDGADEAADDGADEAADDGEADEAADDGADEEASEAKGPGSPSTLSG